MELETRPYQERCHQAIRSEYAKGVTRQLISMATGTGKTVVFAQLPDRMRDVLPGQELVLAHRDELINQAVEKIQAANPRLRVDKEKADYYADTSLADVIVASVASLGRADSKRMARYNWERIDKYVTDEAHHSVASSYMNIYEAAGLLRPDNKRLLLGVTATPQRGDGKALAAIYQKVSFVYSLRQAIEEGWLVDVRGIRVSTNTSLDAVKLVGGDFAQGALADTVNTPERNQLVVKAWLEHGQRRQTIGFTVDIQHARDLAEMFRYYGVKAEAIWGTDPERQDKLARHKRRDTTVLLNCGVLTEGYDDWRIGCVLLARPTKSGSLYVQMVGRGTRLQEPLGNLKQHLEHYLSAGWSEDSDVVRCKRDCIVIDVVDASFRHSLVTLPTIMGMAAKLDLRGGSLVGAIQQIEAVQKEFPDLDFSKLTDLSQLETLVEEVNLFDVKFPPEVEANSELSWHPAPDGGYVLLLPEKQKLQIRQNLLDKWDITGIIGNNKVRGERGSIEEAFSAADTFVTTQLADSLKLVNREERWHSDPATPKQLFKLRKMMGRSAPISLTKGQASRLIGSLEAGKG